MVKLIGKMEIFWFKPAFVKLTPGSSEKWAKNVHFSDILHNISKTNLVTP